MPLRKLALLAAALVIFALGFFLFRTLISRDRLAQPSAQETESASVPELPPPSSSSMDGSVVIVAGKEVRQVDLRTKEARALLAHQTLSTAHPTAYALDSAGHPHLLTENAVVNLKLGRRWTTPHTIGMFPTPRNLAYDSKRERFLIVDQVGTGARILTVAPKSNTWQKLRDYENGPYLGQITYNEREDAIYAIPDAASGRAIDRVLVFTPDMEPIREIPLKPALKLDPRALLHLQFAGDSLLLVLNPTRESTLKDHVIYGIDPRSGEARREW